MNYKTFHQHSKDTNILSNTIKRYGHSIVFINKSHLGGMRKCLEHNVSSQGFHSNHPN